MIGSDSIQTDAVGTVERKFVGDLSMWQFAKDLLNMHCLPDPKYPVGLVESVYFDDPAFSAYGEKVNGDALKRKVRIRWYRNSLDERSGRVDAFLEIKDRIYASRAKKHIGFEANLEELLETPLHAEYWQEVLRRAAKVGGRIVPDSLAPSISVRYTRNRYICPVSGRRIALDAEISSPRANASVMMSVGPLQSAQIVCEVKGIRQQEFSWSESLFRLGFRAQSFSKYGILMKARFCGGLE